ncbi:restriction endonuclease subunit S [Desulforudis sp. 1088]|uniref:restriction endonuclease subunit S n=1 Tax=unclassified Candidatus Desulforudis TaxID=2635950 RepID=UPI003CE469F1
MGKEVGEVMEGYKETEIGVLPEEWDVVRIDDLVIDIVSGEWGSEKQIKGYIPCYVIRGTDFPQASLGSLTGIPVRFLSPKKLEKRNVFAGDVLVELSGGSKDQPTGRVLMITKRLLDRCSLPICFSNFVKLLRLQSKCYPAFFELYWQYLYSQGATRLYEKRTTGIRNFKLNDFLSNEYIPLPPLPEQRKIAHVLSTIQRAIELQDRIIAAVRELKRSLMRHLFTYGPVPVDQIDRVSLKETEIGPVPEHWDIVPLGECAFVQTGVAKGRKLEGSDILEVPYLRVANVQDGYLDLSEIKYIKIRKSEVKRYLLEPGDVVLTEGGDFDKLGRGFIWRGGIQNCVHQNHIFAIRVNRRILLPEFVAYLIQSHYGKSYFLSVAHRTTHLACINTTKLKTFPVLIPTINEQQKIVAILSSVDHKIQAEEIRKNTLDALFKTLLYNLMTGKVRVKALEVNVDAPGR